MRTGIGYDIHRLVPNRKLIIGGVEIPHEKGLSGHSDADVLLHAVCDALLGAAGLGDIGQHFPDTDSRYKGIDSKKLLEQTVQLLVDRGFTPGNIDCIVVAEAPKMGPYREAIINNLATVLGIERTSINFKAKTDEGLGPIGQKEAIAAWVVVTIEKK